MKSLTSYQKKFFMLAGAVFLLLLLSYHGSVKKAFTERKLHRQLKEKQTLIANLDTEMRKWNQLNLQMDRQFGNSAVQSFHENLLNAVGNFCERKKLTLTEFSEPFTGVDGGYSVETIILTIEGGFIPLLQLINMLETEFRGGKIASVGFYKKKNFKTGRDELFVKLYMQKINKQADETKTS